jgi:hypothetical protein
MPITESILEQMRAVAIAGAGVCTAIILLLVQVPKTTPLFIATCAASLGILVWLAAWQYVQPFIIGGQASYKLYSPRVAGLIAVSGILVLFLALTSLIWHLSSCVALIFSVLALLLAFFVCKHIRSVLRIGG